MDRNRSIFIDALTEVDVARARGRKGGRKPVFTPAKVRLAQVAMKNRDTSIPVLCKELGVSPMTLYRYISPTGELRESAKKVISARRKQQRQDG